ncbi:S1 domain-containing RNA-binding protein [Enterococcus sp. LJL90]
MSIEVGAKLQGKVSGITNFGAFIDLGGGKTGLVHISEVSNGYVKDIHDVLTVGDEVTVKVTSVGNDGKIGLSIRQTQEQPADAKPEVKKEFRPRPPQKKSFSKPAGNSGGKDDFDTLMSSFLKDSDDRLSSLRRNTEGKRGGRGGRRN